MAALAPVTDLVKLMVMEFVPESNALNVVGVPDAPPAAIVLVGKSLAKARVTYTLLVR